MDGTSSTEHSPVIASMLSGALAGLVATVPMTVAMELMHRRLPQSERYPLPPREITMEVAKDVGIRERMSEPERLGATLVSHFAYGTAAGALYAPLARNIRVSPPIKGACYGLILWAGSYLGLMPALGILRPATEHPPHRNALMIAAHLLWGSVAGAVVDKLENED